MLTILSCRQSTDRRPAVLPGILEQSRAGWRVPVQCGVARRLCSYIHGLHSLKSSRVKLINNISSRDKKKIRPITFLIMCFSAKILSNFSAGHCLAGHGCCVTSTRLCTAPFTYYRILAGYCPRSAAGREMRLGGNVTQDVDATSALFAGRGDCRAPTHTNHHTTDVSSLGKLCTKQLLSRMTDSRCCIYLGRKIFEQKYCFSSGRAAGLHYV